MKSIEALGISVRVLGIFLLVTLLRDMPLTMMATSQFNNDFLDTNYPMIIYVVLSFIFLICTLIMIKFPISISKLLLPKTEISSSELNNDLDTLQITAITILGIYILSSAIPDLTNNILSLINLKEYMPHDEVGITFAWHSLITTFLEILIGIYCTLGAKGIINIIHRCRS